jgi:hypothetical protein
MQQVSHPEPGHLDWLGAYNRSLDAIPWSEGNWKQAHANVLDTASTLLSGIRATMGVEPDADLLIGLTRLVMEEKVRPAIGLLDEIRSQQRTLRQARAAELDLLPHLERELASMRRNKSTGGQKHLATKRPAS